VPLLVEISLRDILEAHQQLKLIKNKIKATELIKNKVFLLISFIATFYAIGGLTIYLIINSNLLLKRDLGLIIAIVSIVIAMIAILYTQLQSRRSISLNLISEKGKYNDDNFDIVHRWKIIEDQSRKLMTETDKKESNSIGFQIRFLSHMIARDEKEYFRIRELLQLRNKILHENYRLNPREYKEFLAFADDLIERLESINVPKPEEKSTLKIIKAVYGTPTKSLDATKILNSLVNNNRLEFIANNEIVGDPDVGTTKELSITYEINNKKFTKIFKEGEKVIIDKQNK
jgi:hypothetical protein